MSIPPGPSGLAEAEPGIAQAEPSDTAELAIEMLYAIAEHEAILAVRFYEIFFAHAPEAVPLFGKYPLAEQEEMIGETLKSILASCENASWLETNLEALGKSHFEYGVTSEMYPVFVASFVETVAEILGPRYDGAARCAFEEALEKICRSMQRAGEAAEAGSRHAE